MARFIHLRALVELVFCAGIKIVRAMRWGSMHRASALLGGYVVRQHTKDLAIKKRMRKRGVFQLLAREARNNRCSRELAGLNSGFGQGLRYDIQFATVFQR